MMSLVKIMQNSALAGVFLSGRRVGTLGYRDGSTWFEYEDRDPQHPILGQCFEENPDRRRTGSGTIPAWFANLLPERDSGLRRLIAEELGREKPHDFQVLIFLGEDLPGAVRVIPESNLADIPELAERDESPQDFQIRFSLAGVQPKFSMLQDHKGLVLPTSGRGGDWIVKLPDRRFPNVPENEYSMLYWARLTGIDVPATELLEAGELSGLPAGMISEGELAFAVRRFDRLEGGRIHQEDFAQVREVTPELKYENATYSGIARLINAVCPDDMDEYIRRLAAMIVMGNLDAHLKNWTVRYPDGRTARLSPAYDFVSVAAYPEFHAQRLAFRIDGGRTADRVGLGNFMRFAELAQLQGDHVLELVVSTIESMIVTWPQVKDECRIPNFVAAHIDQRLTDLPLVTEVKNFR
jgi:serine/threonine-protein kinase HipA